jgi:protein-disulfide isomerase
MRRIFTTLILGMAVIFAAIFFYHDITYENHLKAARTKDDFSVSIGPRTAPHVVVEFLDYACPFCPTLSQNLVEAAALEGDVRVIIRPVGWVSPESEDIAKFLMAVAKQKKLDAVHARFMRSPTPSLVAIKAMAQMEGVDIRKAEKDMAQMAAPLYNDQLMISLDSTKVPSIVIGDKIFTPSDSLPTVNELRFKLQDMKQ